MPKRLLVQAPRTQPLPLGVSVPPSDAPRSERLAIDGWTTGRPGVEVPARVESNERASLGVSVDRRRGERLKRHPPLLRFATPIERTGAEGAVHSGSGSPLTRL